MLPPVIQHFSEYGTCESMRHPTNELLDEAPWLPFRTRLDFEVAELAHQAAFNKEKTNQLINLMHQSGGEGFTLRDNDDVQELWKLAAFRRTGVSVAALTWFHLSDYSSPTVSEGDF
jgi:hypothetical protein